MLGKGQDAGKVTQTYRMIPTFASQCSPTVHFSQAPTTEEIRERISCQQAGFASPLYIPHITPEGTMCLWWQVAIVHNVLMLTKCQFDPWDRWVGWGCGSWILKQATVWCSYGDSRRHDTDETGNYLPNGRQIQGREWEKRGGRGKKNICRTDEGLSITFKKDTKADTALVILWHLSSEANAAYLSHQRYMFARHAVYRQALWGWHFFLIKRVPPFLWLESITVNMPIL